MKAVQRVTAFVALVAVACGGLTREDGNFDPAADGAAPIEDAGGPTDVAYEADGASDVDAAIDAASDGPDAACQSSPGPWLATCCKGTACAGICTESGCKCGMVEGGCWDGAVCCLHTNSCTSEEICESW